ncbi:MAG TPA: glucosaminidase domain-containing protein [Edaphocola sp.]|nr:glucosaminidase domain-containing protein [Edaphocola sp.]
MRTKVLFLLTVSIFFIQSSFAQIPDYVQNYISKYKDIALREQQRTGIPSAIKLAQGLYETGFGASELCVNAKNHFGIKCKNYWTGETYSYTDDRKDECFRKYTDDSSSYLDHSNFLKGNKRYASLFTLDVKDYKSWANELKKCGYATNPKYAQKIIELIERYDLQQYTLLAIPEYGDYGDNDDFINDHADQDPIKNYYIQTEKNNIKGFYAKKGDMLLNAAYKFNIRYTKLLELNDLNDEPLSHDMFIYLNKKNKTGSIPQYKFQNGDNLIFVAQEYGIRLSDLRQYNNLKPNEEPKEGTLLSLNGAPITKNSVQNNKPILPTEITNNEPPAANAYELEQSPEVIVAPTTASRTNVPQKQKEEIYNISNEPAVAEQIAKEEAIIKEPIAVKASDKKENIEVAVKNSPTKETKITAPIETEDNSVKEPMSDLDRLKAKLDKSVYGKKNSNAIIANKEEEKRENVKIQNEQQTTPLQQPKEDTYVTRPASGQPINQDQLKRKIEQYQKNKNDMPSLSIATTNEVFTPQTTPKSNVLSKSAHNNSHLVVKGDTLFSIAEKNGTTVAELIKLNKLPANGAIKLGQTLRLK